MIGAQREALAYDAGWNAGQAELRGRIEAVLPRCVHELACCIRTGHGPALCQPCRIRRDLRDVFSGASK